MRFVDDDLTQRMSDYVIAHVYLHQRLFTRFAALNLAATMAVAFFIAHKGAFTGDKPGELAFIYLTGFVALIFTGGGKYSADGGR